MSKNSKCTHGKGFCPVHQAGCEVHYYIMPDGKCSCKSCAHKISKPKKPKLTNKQLKLMNNTMTPDQMCVELAKLDGWTNIEYYTPHGDMYEVVMGGFWRGNSKGSDLWSSLPKYTLSYDCIFALIDRVITRDEIDVFNLWVAEEVRCRNIPLQGSAIHVVRLSPQQWCKIVLLTKEKYDTNKGTKPQGTVPKV